MANIKVPYLDLKAQYRSIKPEIEQSVARVLDSCQFVLGPEVAELKENSVTRALLEAGMQPARFF
jgi:dTDP-4-amino-4,6-dideoxygalactose transaminase